MLTPIWMLIKPETVLRLIGMGFRLIAGEQVRVRLGDAPAKLMRHAGYKRVGRRVRQVIHE
jgi:hypothetical protein